VPDVRVLLHRLEELAPSAHATVLHELIERCATSRLRVLVAGEAKRGKSTLVNALVGRDILPSGVVPVTAVATTIRFEAGAADRVDVRFSDGRHQARPLDVLATLVTEAGNPHNVLGITEVVVTVGDGPLSRHRLELVDTPGVGSVHEHNSAAARSVYGGLDAVLVVLGVDPPITAAERDLLVELVGHAVATFVVLNKADRLSPGEVVEAVEFTRAVAASVRLDVPLWAVSARDRDEGFRAFADAFDGYLERHVATDAERALHGHVRRLAHAVRDDLLLRRRALDMDDAEQRGRLEEFTRRLELLQRQARELDDELRVVQQRLRRTLDADAARLTAGVTAAALAAVRGRLDAAAQGASAEQIERIGRETLAEVAREEVTRWRDQYAGHLTDELAQAVSRIDDARRAQLEALRSAARDLLEVDLSLSGGDLQLAEGQSFWFSFEHAPGWEPPLGAVMRLHGPGAAARARRRAVEWVPRTVDKQVGRARSDLQERLAETIRKVEGDLRRGHQQLLDRLAEIVQDVEETGRATGPVRDRRRAVLAQHLTTVEGVIEQLAAVPVAGP
jgi:GTP-binding protein EngB required for normal cell division